MFGVRKRNASLRRFFYAPNLCLIEKPLIIITFGVIILCLELLIIRNKISSPEDFKFARFYYFRKGLIKSVEM